MALNTNHEDGQPDSDKHFVDETLAQKPGIQIFLQPIAPPAALGLAGFAGSTWITSSYIADWWGNSESPTIFFPFVSKSSGFCVGWRERERHEREWEQSWLIEYGLTILMIGRHIWRSRTVHCRAIWLQSKRHARDRNKYDVGCVLD